MLKQNKNPIIAYAKKPLVLAVTAVVIVGIIVWATHHSTTPASTKVAAPTASSSAVKSSSSTAVTKKPSATNGVNQGGATDKNGQAPAITSNPSQWTSSASGQITLQQPLNNSTFKSGDYMSGTAKVSQVQYRLIDNSVGVIAQGSLGVVGGKFSGIISFQSHSNTGQLDVFSYNSMGAEVNELKVNLNF